MTSRLNVGIARDGQRVRLAFERLETHLHVLGLTGGGKTRWLANLFREILWKTDASPVIVDPKGDLAELATQVALAEGFRRDLLVWDFRERSVLMGYDPLARGQLEVHKRAKHASEATRAAWGQAVFDSTPRLDHWLYVSYAASCYLGLGVQGALDLLRVDSPVRTRVLASIPDAWIHAELSEFEALPPSRRAEVSESTVTRLGKFVGDPAIGRILNERKHVLDLDEVLFGERRRILVVNLACPEAVTADDCRLLGRFVLNDLLCRRLSRGRTGARRPTVLFLDELGYLITHELCRALDWGRAFKLWCVLSHQYLGQLRKEDPMLEQAVLADARTKVVIGGALVQDLQQLVPELAIEEFDPYAVKDEIRGLELNPIETVRVVRSDSRATSRQLSLSETCSGSDGESWGEGETETDTRTTTLQRDRTIAQGVSEAIAHHRAHSRGWGRCESDADTSSAARMTTSSSAEAIGSLPNDVGASLTTVTGFADGRALTTARVSGRSEFEMESESEGVSRQQAITNAVARREGIATAAGRAVGRSGQRGGSRSRSAGQSAGATVGETETVGYSLQPWYEYEKSWPVRSREFKSREEFLTEHVVAMKRQRTAQLTIKVPNRPVLHHLRAPTMNDSHLTARALAERLASVYAQPCYRDLEREPIRERRRAATPRRRGRVRKLPPPDEGWDC